MSGVRLAWLHLRVGVMNEMQYRANFFIQLVQSVVRSATGLVALAVIFDHTTDLNGWSRPELLVVMGVFTMVGGLIGFAIEPNMGRVLSDIHQGTFDYVLTKPADSQLLSSVRQFHLWRLVDVGRRAGRDRVGAGAARRRRSAVDDVAGFVLTLVAGHDPDLLPLVDGDRGRVLGRADGRGAGPVHGSLPRRPVPGDRVPGRPQAGAHVPRADRVRRHRAGGEPDRAADVGRVSSSTALFLVVVMAITRLVWRAGTRHYSGASA